jgi:putative transposase
LDPRISKKILKDELRKFIEKRFFDVQDYHPDVEIEKYSIEQDHVHVIIIILHKYSVSNIIGKIKANISRDIRKRFSWVKKIYWRNELWSPRFFSSTLGINEDAIKRYGEFQEKIDKGQLQLNFDFKL